MPVFSLEVMGSLPMLHFGSLQVNLFIYLYIILSCVHGIMLDNVVHGTFC